MSTMSAPNGSVVAFEGPADVITTQLHLLPASSQILVLPSVDQYLEEADIAASHANTDSADEEAAPSFDGRDFIRKVCDAASVRRDIAMDFLNRPAVGATGKKKFVFLQGGTASSLALCIDTLRQRDPAANGELDQAAQLFDELAAEVVMVDEQTEEENDYDSKFYAPTSTQSSQYTDSRLQSLNASNSNNHNNNNNNSNSSSSNSNSSNSNGNNNTLNLPVTSVTPHSPSLPITGWGDLLSADDFPAKRFSRASSTAAASDTFESFASFAASSRASPVSSAFLTPTRTDAAGSSFVPQHHATASFGAEDNERPVLIGPAPRGRSQRRTRSLERTPATSRQRFDDAASDFPSRDPSTRRYSGISIAAVGGAEKKMQKMQNEDIPDVPLLPGAEVLERLTRQKLPQRLQLRESVYVERTVSVERYEEAPSRPVLPFIEDLAIHFTEGEPDSVLDLAIRRCKDMVAMVAHNALLGREEEQEDVQEDRQVNPTFPATPTSVQDRALESELLAAIASNPYKPFAPQPQSPQTIRSMHTALEHSDSSKRSTLSIAVPQPPTPERTPSPSRTSPHVAADGRMKFHDFSVDGYLTAVAMQNALRSVIGMYFPMADEPETSMSALCFPELDGSLWQPLFEDTGADRIDLILALGAQKGVTPEFKAKITARLDVLGSKATGETRSGRLDMRYLTSNAMQALAAQQMCSCIHSDPLADPQSHNTTQLLGALVVAQLDLYLRTHPTVRFLLLDYPPELLSVVLAMQKLVGRNAVQTIGIVDVDGNGLVDQPPVSEIRNRRESIGPVLGSSEPPFTRVNYLLMSAANNSEVSTFVSTIWKRLSTISSSYYGPQNPILMVNHLDRRQAAQLAPQSTSLSFVSATKTSSSASTMSASASTTGSGSVKSASIKSPAPPQSPEFGESPKKTLQKGTITATSSNSTMKTVASSTMSTSSYATADTSSVISMETASSKTFCKPASYADSIVSSRPASTIRGPPSPVASTISLASSWRGESTWTLNTQPSMTPLAPPPPPPVRTMEKATLVNVIAPTTKPVVTTISKSPVLSDDKSTRSFADSFTNNSVANTVTPSTYSDPKSSTTSVARSVAHSVTNSVANSTINSTTTSLVDLDTKSVVKPHHHHHHHHHNNNSNNNLNNLNNLNKAVSKQPSRTTMRSTKSHASRSSAKSSAVRPNTRSSSRSDAYRQLQDKKFQRPQTPLRNGTLASDDDATLMSIDSQYHVPHYHKDKLPSMLDPGPPVPVQKAIFKNPGVSSAPVDSLREEIDRKLGFDMPSMLDPMTGETLGRTRTVRAAQSPMAATAHDAYADSDHEHKSQKALKWLGLA